MAKAPRNPDHPSEADLTSMRRASREAELAAPKIRAATFKSAKDYRRKPKHKEQYND